jgi:hypothetical protein
MTPPILMKDPILGGAAPGALADIFEEDITVRDADKESGPAKMRIQLMLAVQSVVNLVVRDRVGGVKATGSITVVAGADLADEDNFTIDDGFHAAKVFEFDDDAALSIGGAVGITFTGGSTLAQVRTATINAINGAGLFITASADPDDPAVILLEHQKPGEIGNVAIVEDVTNAGFEVAGMVDGEGATAILPLNGGNAIAADTFTELEVWVSHQYSYNLHLETDGEIPYLMLVEKK